MPLPPVVGPWVWAALMGVGVGAGFPLGLAVDRLARPGRRTPRAATSGLALGVGYTAAGLGPLLMGVLIDVTGGYALAIGLLVAGGPGAGVGDLRRSDDSRTRPRRCGRRRAPRPPATPGASPGAVDLPLDEPPRDEHGVGCGVQAREEPADALLGDARVLVVAEHLLQRRRGRQQPFHGLPAGVPRSDGATSSPV